MRAPRVDAVRGLILLFAGGLALALTWSYPSGRAADFGPGMVVQGASGVIVLLGAATLVHAMTPRRRAAARRFMFLPSWRPLLVPAAMGLFAILLPLTGLAVCAFLATLAAGFASGDLTRRERVVTAVVLAAFVTLLFGYGLRLPVAIWPPGLSP